MPSSQSMPTTHRSPRGPHSRGLWTTAFGLVLALLVGFLTMLSATSASADAAAVVNVTISPVDVASGQPITEARHGARGNLVSYKVAYSCTAAACLNTQVQLSPSQPDPHGLLPANQFLLKYSAWTAPSGVAGTIDGTDAAGKRVRLGDLAAGASGTFTVTYAHEGQASSVVPNGSFYPDGFQVTRSATISSDTASAATAAATPVTWRIDLPNGPRAGLSPAGGSFRTGVPVDHVVSVNGGNMGTVAGSNVAGLANFTAVGNYKVVYTLPPQATIQSASHDGVIDHVAHTVTWTKGSANAPVYGARGAFGLSYAGGYNSSGPASRNGPTADSQAFWQPRTVTVVYPGANFPEADPTGCNFSTTVSSSVDVSVTYLDQSRTTKKVDEDMTAQVACRDPFGGLAVSKRVYGGASNQYGYGDGDMGSGIFALNVPAPGQTDRELQWRVDVANRGNVAGVAVIDEPNLVHDHIKVHKITVGVVGAKVDWTADNGSGTLSSGSTTLAAGQSVAAPAGGWFTKAKATTTPIPAGRILPTDNTEKTMQMYYWMTVSKGAPLGQLRTNTANVSMTYPGYAAEIGGQPLTDTAQRTVRYTLPTGRLTAEFTAAPVVDGGGPLNPGTPVTFAMRGYTDTVWPGTKIKPQIVFLAPVGWTVLGGSAAIPGAPVGTTVTQTTKTVAGVTREVVVVTYPAGIEPPMNRSDWATLSVQATPTATAPSGTPTSATVWVGDAGGTWRTAVSTGFQVTPEQFRASGAVTDAPDVDGDGNSTESFASSTSSTVTVDASDGVRVVKELCVPSAAPGGCTWVASTATPHPVASNADDLRYRVTVTNSGNAPLHDVVVYDVLPHEGDTGLMPASPARGSQFALTLGVVSSVSSGVTMAYSASTDPARPEVNPGTSANVDDWGAVPTGRKAIRMKVDADLAPGATKSFEFVAAIGSGAEADEKACNTVAIDTRETLPTEPQAVCVRVVEADLSVTAGTQPAWKVDTATEVSFSVVNKGGSDNSPASVELNVPAGLRVDSLTPTGWTCTAPGGVTAPLAGPVQLTCVPVDGSGDPRTLARDAAETLALSVTPTEVSTTNRCVEADITGPWYDPVLVNNTTSVCQQIVPPFVPAPKLELLKSSLFTTDVNGDGKADKGDVLKYSFVVENTGNVDVRDVQISDAKVAAVAPTTADIAAGASKTFTAVYTVTQADVDAGAVRNSATASGTPSSGGTTTSNVSTDVVDGPPAVPAITVVKSAALTTDQGVVGKADVDDVITYSITVRNAGPATAHGVSVVDPLPGLSAVTPATVATLAPGTESVFTATYSVKQRDVDAGEVRNQATASFRKPTPPGGTQPVAQTRTSNEVTVPTVAATPKLTLAKTSAFTTDANGDGKADKGDVLKYSFKVTNSGNVTLTGVTVIDPLPGLGAITPGPVTLAPRAAQTFTASYTVTQSDVDAGGTYNQATAKGAAPSNAPVTSDPDDDSVAGPEPKPVLSVEKTALLTTDHGVIGKGDQGDVVTYTFTVRNTGVATAKDVSVNDALPGLSTISPARVATLAPGDHAVFSATYTVTLADMDAGEVANRATVTYTPPTLRGGQPPAPLTTPPSNLVVTPMVAKAQPSVSTSVPATTIAVKVPTNGLLPPTALTDRVTVDGVKPGGTAFQGTATLYGPVSTPSSGMCTPELKVGSVSFEARNGTTEVPAVQVTAAGYYTWVVSLPGNELNEPAGHACGLAAETVLLHRAGYKAPTISTGFAISAGSARLPAAPSGLDIAGLGIKAPVQTVGARRGKMRVPVIVTRLGWLNSSAAIGDAVGTSVVAGHVSDRRDRPGAFWKLTKARPGETVTMRDSHGVAHQYRVVSTATYPRSRPLPRALFSTTGKPQLVLVSCTDKVKRGGKFHYKRNLVVTAVPLG